MPPIISIVGKSDTGKTTLIEKLIPELKGRGYKIGTIKHASHGFDMDHKGKDSARHWEAGSDATMIASSGKIAMVKKEDWENLKDLEPFFPKFDLIITEGFKSDKQMKIEIYRSEKHQEPACLGDKNLIAFVSNQLPGSGAPDVPLFGPDDIQALVDLIEKKVMG